MHYGSKNWETHEVIGQLENVESLYSACQQRIKKKGKFTAKTAKEFTEGMLGQVSGRISWTEVATTLNDNGSPAQ